MLFSSVTSETTKQTVRFINLVSNLSIKNIDKSNSMLSNGDIWGENRSPDDSKQFIESFYDINKKKNSQFKSKTCNKENLIVIIY